MMGGGYGLIMLMLEEGYGETGFCAPLDSPKADDYRAAASEIDGSDEFSVYRTLHGDSDAAVFFRVGSEAERKFLASDVNLGAWSA